MVPAIFFFLSLSHILGVTGPIDDTYTHEDLQLFSLRRVSRNSVHTRSNVNFALRIRNSGVVLNTRTVIEFTKS